MSRDWPLFAADMLDFCRRIEDFSDGLDFETFIASPKERDALLMNIGRGCCPYPGGHQEGLAGYSLAQDRGHAQCPGAWILCHQRQHSLGPRDRRRAPPFTPFVALGRTKSG